MSVFKIKFKISETMFKISAADLQLRFTYYISIKGTYCVFSHFLSDMYCCSGGCSCLNMAKISNDDVSHVKVIPISQKFRLI